MFRRSLIIIFVLIALPVAAATWVLAPVFIAVKPTEEAPPAAKPTESTQPTGPTDVAKLRDLKALEPRTPTSDPARFDISRINPEGWSVFAGTAPANASVTVTADGVTVGTAQADQNGEWTLSADHRFASADPVLALVTRIGGPPASAGAMPPAAKPDVQEPTKPAQVARAEQPATKPETPKSATAPRPQISADEASKGMMRNLENLVAAARTETSAQQPVQPAATAEAQNAAAAPIKPAAAATPEQPKPADQQTAAAVPPVQPSMPQAPGQAAAPMDKQEPAAEKPAMVAAAVSAPTEPEPRRTLPQAAAVPAAVPVPVPMHFVFREATFTEDGRKAADLLVEYLRLKKPAAISMSGHADERGSDGFNMELSRERLETVAAYLRENGYTGKLTLTPKGRSAPYTGVDRSLYSRDALYQLDRRVEVLLDTVPARAAEASSPTRN